MAYVSTLFDQLRDLLNDPADTQVAFLTKRLYLNRGIAALWPRIWRVASEQIALVQDQVEYDVATSVSGGKIVSVEVSTKDGDGWQRLAYYDLLPGDEDQQAKFVLPWMPDGGQLVRVRYVTPVPLISASTYTAAGSETWVGPDEVIGLPALHAMGMLSIRRLEDYLDANRQRPANEHPDTKETWMLSSSRFWLDQYEAQVDALARPLPVAED